MTARQQIARLLPLVLLIVLVIVGLRGAVSAPGWNGPLKAYGIAIGVALEVIFGVLLLAVRSRERAERRAKEALPYNPADADADKDFEAPQALRFTLKYVIRLCMLAIVGVLISNLNLHFFSSVAKVPPGLQRLEKSRPTPTQTGSAARTGGWGFHIPIDAILYSLLIVAIVAAVAVSIWWSARLRRPAAPLVIEDVSTEELRDAVDEGRAALRQVDDARAAIIACYVAMERSLADRGTAREVADTPDELLARAVASGTVRSGAASRLTSLFYEARFSTHPLSGGQREAASTALDELAEELKVKREPAAAAAAAPSEPKPGGGWV